MAATRRPPETERAGPDRGPRPARPPLDLPRARAVAFDLLSRKPWTRHDLTLRLVRRGAPPLVAAAVLADLVARGHVDDRAFAAAWVETRARARGLGSRRLRQELRTRGVAPALVEAALARVEDEAARARAVADRRLVRPGPGPPEAQARRLQDYLLRRGFPPAVVRRVVREACRVTIDES